MGTQHYHSKDTLLSLFNLLCDEIHKDIAYAMRDTFGK